MARDDMTHNAASGLDTEHAAAVLVIGSLALLMLVRRGFRGVGIPGVGSVNIGG